MKINERFKKIGIFVLFALATYVVSFFAIKDITIVNDDFSAALATIDAINRDQSDKVIIFGSSMGREGIDQKFIESELKNTKIYNLSISSGRPSDFYLLWHRIKNRDRIKLVLLTLSPWVFEKQYTKDIVSGNDPTTRIFFDQTALAEIIPAEKRSLWWLDAQITVLAMPWTGRSFDGKDIFDYIVNSFDSSFPKPAWQQYQYSENKPELYFSGIIADKAIWEEYGVSNFDWDAQANLQLKSLAKISESFDYEKIDFLIVGMPVNPVIKKLYGAGMEDEYRRAVIGSVGGKADFLDFSSQYGKENFIDINHLNRQGREAFSRDLLLLFRKILIHGS